jgi:hypothetical protein
MHNNGWAELMKAGDAGWEAVSMEHGLVLMKRPTEEPADEESTQS